MENLKIKKFKYYRRKFSKYGQIFINLVLIVIVAFLFLQNIHLKRELQFNKANEYKLFNEVNKLEKDVFGLKVSVVALEKFKTDKNIKTEKVQKINKK